MEKEMSAFEKIHVDIVYACMNRVVLIFYNAMCHYGDICMTMVTYTSL